MRMRPFGPKRTPVAVIGQGTWRVADAKGMAPAIEEGLRRGMTHIDTAELYERQSGSETMLGPIVHENRPRLFLASKVLPQNASGKGVASACKDSLVRLQTDHLDLYYHHWRGTVPLEETMRALADLQDKGWVLNIGVSNYDVGDLEEAKGILGPGRIAANQVRYHLEERDVELEVLPWCKRNSVAVVAYSPFGAGSWVRDRSRLAVLEDVAKRNGRTPRQVALAFLTRDPAVFAIPKAEKPAHVAENAGGDFEFPAEDVRAIEAAFPLPV